MTKQDTDELGKRALACKHFYWTQGMLSSSGRRVGVWIPGTVCGASEKEPVWPDLDDPATMGCLLYLVREAWPDEWTDYAVPVHDGFDGWTFGVITRNAGPGQINVTTVFASSVFPWHPSEAAALVAALEAAP